MGFQISAALFVYLFVDAWVCTGLIPLQVGRTALCVAALRHLVMLVHEKLTMSHTCRCFSFTFCPLA